MSRPRSRSPLYSRIPTHHSGRADGLFDDKIHSSVQSDVWRNTEYENKAESNTQWNKDSYQGEQHVDHWAKFIDAIEHAQKGEVSSMSRFHIEGDEERPPYSPRRLPRERLPSPDHARFHMDEHYGMPGSQGWNRNNDSDNEHISQQNHRESRNRSYPRHSEARRYDQLEYGLHKAEHSNHERGFFSESHLGYSSDRQLSLDLVNVGRQRLDFLPMLEHSGTYRESAVHSGTFAQEIITLVHQVKENYFKGQGITLNERFANEQYYSLQDEFKEEEDEEIQSVGLIMNRLGMPLPETQIFCNIGAEPLQRRQPAPAPDPGDLRYDLERRRQQRLEGVKITIAGGSFTQMAPESQESELPYVNEVPDQSEGNFGWSEQQPVQPRQWNGPRQRAAPPNRQNFNPRGNSSRNNRPRGRRT